MPVMKTRDVERLREELLRDPTGIGYADGPRTITAQMNAPIPTGEVTEVEQEIAPEDIHEALMKAKDFTVAKTELASLPKKLAVPVLGPSRAQVVLGWSIHPDFVRQVWAAAETAPIAIGGTH